MLGVALDAQAGRRAHLEVGPASVDTLGGHIQSIGQLHPRHVAAAGGMQYRHDVHGDRRIVNQ